MKKEHEVTDNFYKAVQKYIEEKGGKVVVIGGVGILKQPNDLKYNYSLVIKITGKTPKYEKT